MTQGRKIDRRTTYQPTSLSTNSTTSAANLDYRVNPDRRQRDILDFVGLFSGIPRNLIQGLLEHCSVEKFSNGDLILSKGQENVSIRILLSGQLRVEIGSVTSNECIAVNPGECIGEMSIIDSKPVSANVFAETDCRMLIIHQDHFWTSLGQLPDLARNMLSSLVARMRIRDQAVIQKLQGQLVLEHIQKELAIACNIQASLLPSQHPLFPDRNEVDIFSIMHPAKSVGGDFYDAFFITPNKLFVTVGDVSGKGISAALFMVQSIMHLKTQALLEFSPNEILERVNNSLCKNNSSSMFVTIFCGILDIETGMFEYSNGGHNPPLTNANQGVFEFMPVPRGLVVGFMADVKFQSASLQLKPGDTVFIYTDGVTEAENRQKEMFSDEKLLDLLGSSSDFHCQRIIETIRDEITFFSEGIEQSDDITMLALRYIGPSKKTVITLSPQHQD